MTVGWWSSDSEWRGSVIYWNKICSHPLGFDDNKVLKEQMVILTYVQVCKIITLAFNSEYTILKTYVEKQSLSDSRRSESDDFEGPDSERGGSSSEGLDSDHSAPSSYDSVEFGG